MTRQAGRKVLVVGAGGHDVTPLQRVVIAIQACVLVLELSLDWYADFAAGLAVVAGAAAWFMLGRSADTAGPRPERRAPPRPRSRRPKPRPHRAGGRGRSAGFRARGARPRPVAARPRARDAAPVGRPRGAPPEG